MEFCRPANNTNCAGRGRAKETKMPYITDIRKQAELADAMTTFAATCAANSAALHLDPADVLAIQAMANSFTSALNAYSDAKAASDSAHAAKDAQYASSRATLSMWAKTFRADLTISDALLEQLNLAPHSTPGTKTPPTTPIDLVANPNGLGVVALKWGRNGNGTGTVFDVQTQSAAGGDWTIAASTTKAKFSYQAVSGQYIAFRVSASRNGLTSTPTLPIVLWNQGGGTAELKVA